MVNGCNNCRSSQLWAAANRGAADVEPHHEASGETQDPSSGSVTSAEDRGRTSECGAQMPDHRCIYTPHIHTYTHPAQTHRERQIRLDEINDTITLRVDRRCLFCILPQADVL